MIKNKYNVIVWVWVLCMVGAYAEKITMEMLRMHYMQEANSLRHKKPTAIAQTDKNVEKYVNQFIDDFLANDMTSMNSTATQETIAQLQHARGKIQKVFQKITKCASVVPINFPEAKVICGSSRQSMNIEFSLLWWKNRWIIAGVN